LGLAVLVIFADVYNEISYYYYTVKLYRKWIGYFWDCCHKLQSCKCLRILFRTL